MKQLQQAARLPSGEDVDPHIAKVAAPPAAATGGRTAQRAVGPEELRPPGLDGGPQAREASLSQRRWVPTRPCQPEQLRRTNGHRLRHLGAAVADKLSCRCGASEATPKASRFRQTLFCLKRHQDNQRYIGWRVFVRVEFMDAFPYEKRNMNLGVDRGESQDGLENI